MLSSPPYSWDRREVASGLQDLLCRRNLVTVGFEKAEGLVVLLACAQNVADFGDALIVACARSAGIAEIYSFDKRFERAGLAAIQPH